MTGHYSVLLRYVFGLVDLRVEYRRFDRLQQLLLFLSQRGMQTAEHDQAQDKDHHMEATGEVTRLTRLVIYSNFKAPY